MSSAALSLEPGPDESLDQLTGGWRIFQLTGGHRFSTDDVVTAWHGAEARPDAAEVLDIGSGLCSVGLTTLWLLGNPRARLTAVEAQTMSAALARRTLAYNGLEARVDYRVGDLRDPEVIEPGRQFELITGSPPYIPPDKGLASPHPQRAHCRIELRGGIDEYCAAARRWLAPGGRFAFCMTAWDARTEAAPERNGLRVIDRVDWVFRVGREPHIATLVCARAEDPSPPRTPTRRLVVREADGGWSDFYLGLRDRLGFPPPPA